ncbi:MAG: hypothetical protein ACREJO_04760 [Phycisphaerales bacterium]
MPHPSTNLITSTRWRTVDALMAIAEDAKASARERRLAAMAILEICDQAESTLTAAATPTSVPTLATPPTPAVAAANRPAAVARPPTPPPPRSSPAAPSHAPAAPTSPQSHPAAHVAGHSVPAPTHHTAELPCAA